MEHLGSYGMGYAAYEDQGCENGSGMGTENKMPFWDARTAL